MLQNYDYNIGFFYKNAIFFAESCRKLQKIVIITSTPVLIQGDSGGPLYKVVSGQPVLYGIAMQGSRTCNVGMKSRALAANVIHFAPWIRRNSR
jgi:secreted trypsin-like serine protease